MRATSVLKDVPWLVASLGLGYLATIAGGGPRLSAALGATAGLIGAKGLFQSIIHGDEHVRRHLAYVLWKLKKNARRR